MRSKARQNRHRWNGSNVIPDKLEGPWAMSSKSRSSLLRWPRRFSSLCPSSSSSTTRWTSIQNLPPLLAGVRHENINSSETFSRAPSFFCSRGASLLPPGGGVRAIFHAHRRKKGVYKSSEIPYFLPHGVVKARTCCHKYHTGNFHTNNFQTKNL